MDWLSARTARPVVLGSLGLLAGACFSLDELEGTEVEHKTYVEDWRDEVIYQILTDRFADGDRSNDFGVHASDPARYHGGDWLGIEQHLDYVQALGVTTIWISPIIKNVETDASIDGYHGYWAQDFRALNPHFGDMAALRSMVKAAHARRMKVVLDIVTNHVGQLFFYDINGNGVPDEAVWGGGNADSPIEHRMEYDPDYEEPVVKARTSLGEAGPAPVLFFRDATTNRMPPIPEALQSPAAYHRRGRVYNWGNDECCFYQSVGEAVPDWCTCAFYDAAKQARPRWCLSGNADPICNQVPNGDFPGGLKDLATETQPVRDAMFQVYGRWLSLVDFDGFRIDTLKHVDHGFWKDFCPRIRTHVAGFGKRNFLMFGEAFTGFDRLIGSYTQPGELDGAFYFSQKYVIDAVFKRGEATRKVKDLFDQRAANYGSNPQERGAGQPPSKLVVGFLDNHDVARFLYDKPSVPALHSALAFLFTEDGIPCLYYGTEQQFRGGNDPANRENLWETGFATGGATFQFIRTLAAIRKQHPALRRGEVEFKMWTEDAEGAGILAFERVTGDQRVLVVLNTHDTEARQTARAGTPMKVGLPPGTALTNVLPDDDAVDSAQVDASGSLDITIGPRATKVFVAQ
jgi:glycosidase